MAVFVLLRVLDTITVKLSTGDPMPQQPAEEAAGSRKLHLAHYPIAERAADFFHGSLSIRFTQDYLLRRPCAQGPTRAFPYATHSGFGAFARQKR